MIGKLRENENLAMRIRELDAEVERWKKCQKECGEDVSSEADWNEFLAEKAR